MSQHYLKYHFKSFICTIINNAAIDEVNGNNGNDSETDMMNGNKCNMNINNNNNNGNTTASITTTSALCSNNSKLIRITENPLTDNIVN
jgi:hypothetical protein